MNPYRILIADDHPLARKAIRSLLEDEPGFEIVGEAWGGRDAVELSTRLAPDVVLIDIRMPDLNGLEATRMIKQQNPGTKVVILSVSDSVQDLFTAIQYGAQGYLLKDMDSADWLSYLHALLNDGPQVPRQMADKLFHRFKSVPSAGGALPQSREKDMRAVDGAGAGNRYLCGGGSHQPANFGAAVYFRAYGKKPYEERAGQAESGQPGAAGRLCHQDGLDSQRLTAGVE